MSASAKPRTTPARIVLILIGSLLSLLLSTLVLSQLNLPYFGKTVWDLLAAVTTAAIVYAGHLVVWASYLVATKFPLITAMLGVGWLISIYFRVNRTGDFQHPAWDTFMFSLSLGLLWIYVCFLDKILPVHAEFFYRVALFCSIALVTFCVGVQVARFEGRIVSTESEVCGLFLAIAGGVGLLVGLVTGCQGSNPSSSHFWSFQLPNAVLHLVANCGGLGLGIWFYAVVEDRRALGD